MHVFSGNFDGLGVFVCTYSDEVGCHRDNDDFDFCGFMWTGHVTLADEGYRDARPILLRFIDSKIHDGFF